MNCKLNFTHSILLVHLCSSRRYYHFHIGHLRLHLHRESSWDGSTWYLFILPLLIVNRGAEVFGYSKSRTMSFLRYHNTYYINWKIWTFIIIQLQVGPDSSIFLYYHEHHILATVLLSTTLSAPWSMLSGSRPNWSGANPSVTNLPPFANWLAVAIMPPKLTLSSGTMTGLLTLM